ncbi:MAG: DUF2520 domain-containing protein [Actinomycetota bacterium]|nr:DUF2520 domain-containing protein [Actinomycetota bacterium]
MTATPAVTGAPPARSFSVIGNGRAGASFAVALRAAGWTLVHVFGRDDDPTHAAADASVVLLTVPDGAIATVAQRIKPGPALVAHVAGSLPIDVLAPHRRIASLHPLMSLPDPIRGAARLLDRCTFAVAGDPIARSMVADLGGRAVEVADEDRPLYHAAACVAANHLVGLCGQVQRLAALVGVPVDAYWKLMTTTLDNVVDVGPSGALTGPAARGDWTTIQRHLAHLPASERASYLTMVEQAAVLAGRELPADLWASTR